VVGVSGEKLSAHSSRSHDSRHSDDVGRHSDDDNGHVSDDNEASHSDSSAATDSVGSGTKTSGRLDVDHMYSDQSQDGQTRSRTTVIRDIVKVTGSQSH